MTNPYIAPLPNDITDASGKKSLEFERWLIQDNQFKEEIYRLVLSIEARIEVLEAYHP